MSDDRLSKSARKREAQAVRALADRLVALAPDELARIVPDGGIVEAVRAARGMPSHGAGRRQRQYIAKLLRQVDTEAIVDAMDRAEAAPAAQRRQFHAAERLRDELLRGADPAETLTAAGLQRNDEIESAVSQWHRARGDGERKRLARALFRALHEQLGDRGDDTASG